MIREASFEIGGYYWYEGYDEHNAPGGTFWWTADATSSGNIYCCKVSPYNQWDEDAWSISISDCYGFNRSNWADEVFPIDPAAISGGSEHIDGAYGIEDIMEKAAQFIKERYGENPY